MTELSQKILKRFLKYNQITGKFTWRVKRGPRRKDERAGSKHSEGYIQINFLGKVYFAHRLAFLYITGRWPDEIDHINHNRRDNRWLNLRECTHKENLSYQKVNKANTTGYKGVSKSRGRFRAYIVKNGKQIFLGRHNTKEEAALAYNNAAINLFGRFAYLNILGEE